MDKLSKKTKKTKFIHDFFQTFDIDRLKDRENHEYLEGGRAEERVKEYLNAKYET